MAEASVIKEFLVSLGFKSDEAALKKFSTGISQATKTVLALSIAVEAAAIAVSAGIMKFTSNLESLYFSATRVGTSVTSLKAFGIAARNMGASVEGAQSSVEGLARFLRTNPGGEDYLKTLLGVDTRDAQGNLRDMTELLIDVGQAMAKLPINVAQNFLMGTLGMDEKTMLLLRDGKIPEEYRRILASIDKDKLEAAAVAAHNFQVAMQGLKLELTLLGAELQKHLLDKYGFSIETVTKFLREHHQQIIDGFDRAIKKVEQIWHVIEPVLTWIGKQIAWLDEKTGGWGTQLIILLGILKMVGAFSIVGGIWKVAEAFIGLGRGMAWLTAGPMIAALGALGPVLLAVGGAAGLGMLLSVTPWAKKAGEWASRKITETHGTTKNEDIISALMNGLNIDRAAASGIVARLTAESNMQAHGPKGDGGLAEGVAQWHPHERGKYEEWAKAEHRPDFAHSGLMDQIEFLNYDIRTNDRRVLALLHAAKNNPSMAYDAFTKYENPADPNKDRGKNQAMAININAQINIDGAESAELTARAVKEELDGMRSEAVRNVQGALQ